MTKKTYPSDFEKALQQRGEKAQQVTMSDVATIMRAELIVAGIEQGTINGLAADTFLIAANQHVPQGDTTIVGMEDQIISKSEIQGARHPHIGGAEFGASRKTSQDRVDIVERQALISEAQGLSLDI